MWKQSNLIGFAVTVVMVLFLCFYAWAYFAFSDFYEMDEVDELAGFRTYSPSTSVVLFEPLAKIESLFRGGVVLLDTWEEPVPLPTPAQAEKERERREKSRNRLSTQE